MDPFRKSLWRERTTQTWGFYCPSCRAPRRVPMHPQPARGRTLFQVGLTTAIFVLLTWNWFSWKGVVAFVPLWTAFEILYRGKMRAALPCDQCGFDPFLYMTDVQRARREMETHWRRKFAEKGIPFPEKNPPLGEPGSSVSGESQITP